MNVRDRSLNEENDWVRRIDQKCREVGYTRRPEQSTAMLGSVPAAVIQEARDGCAQGDARSLLTRVLVHAGVEAGDDMATVELAPFTRGEISGLMWAAEHAPIPVDSDQNLRTAYGKLQAWLEADDD